MSRYFQMHLPLNQMILKDGQMPLEEQMGWYEPIFQALAEGGQVLVCCKNGVHRSRCNGCGGTWPIRFEIDMKSASNNVTWGVMVVVVVMVVVGLVEFVVLLLVVVVVMVKVGVVVLVVFVVIVAVVVVVGIAGREHMFPIGNTTHIVSQFMNVRFRSLPCVCVCLSDF